MPVNLQSILEGLAQANPQMAEQIARRKSARELLQQRLFQQGQESQRTDLERQRVGIEQGRAKAEEDYRRQQQERQSKMDERQAGLDEQARQDRQLQQQLTVGKLFGSGDVVQAEPAGPRIGGVQAPSPSEQPSQDFPSGRTTFAVPGGDPSARFMFASPEEHEAFSIKQAKQQAEAERQQRQEAFQSYAKTPTYKAWAAKNPQLAQAKEVEAMTGLKVPDETESNFKAHLAYVMQYGGAEEAKRAKGVLETLKPPSAASISMGGANGGLTDEGMNMAADYYADKGVLPQGMGIQSGEMRKAIINRAAERHPGSRIATNAAALHANTQTLTGLLKNRDALSAFEKTAGKNLDLYEQQMKKVVDTNSPWINKPLREIDEKALGGEDVPAYRAARQVAMNEVSRIISNPTLTGVLSDTARKEASELNPDSATLGQTHRVLGVLRQDMKNRADAYDSQIREQAGRLAQGVGGLENLGAPTPPPTGGSWFDQNNQ